jgi:hypothetical protein
MAGWLLGRTAGLFVGREQEERIAPKQDKMYQSEIETGGEGSHWVISSAGLMLVRPLLRYQSIYKEQTS